MSEVNFLREVAQVFIPRVGLIELNEFEDGTTVLCKHYAVEGREDDLIVVEELDLSCLAGPAFISKHGNVASGKAALCAYLLENLK